LGRVPRPLINLLTVAEVEALMNAPSPQTVLGLRDRAVLETLYGTGIRRAELVALDLTDVDMQSLTLLVKRGKNQRSRVLPVGDRLSHALKEYLLHGRPHLQARLAEPALFVGHRGQRLDKSAVDHVMRHHSRKAGFKRTVGAHSLRHAFAGHMLRNGADLRSLQAMLGHESLASTQQYTRIYLEDLQKEHRRTHPRSKRRSTWRPDGWL
jgi:integrase/recombinase XerD